MTINKVYKISTKKYEITYLLCAGRLALSVKVPTRPNKITAGIMKTIKYHCQCQQC